MNKAILSTVILPSGGRSTLYNNLVAYWTLNEAAGQTRSDSVGSNHLTEGSTPIVSSAGKLGNAPTFVAAEFQRLQIADNAALSMGDVNMSIACWVNLGSVAAAQFIVAKYLGAAGRREYYIQVTATPRFGFGVRNTAQTVSAEVTANNFGTPSTGTWYLVCASHDADNNQLHISVNAGTRDTLAHTGGIYDGTSDFKVGGADAGNYLDGGRVDALGIWKGRILTVAEEAELYNGGAGKALY